jgi:hypothetical protein
MPWSVTLTRMLSAMISIVTITSPPVLENLTAFEIKFANVSSPVKYTNQN